MRDRKIKKNTPFDANVLLTNIGLFSHICDIYVTGVCLTQAMRDRKMEKQTPFDVWKETYMYQKMCECVKRDLYVSKTKCTPFDVYFSTGTLTHSLSFTHTHIHIHVYIHTHAYARTHTHTVRLSLSVSLAHTQATREHKKKHLNTSLDTYVLKVCVKTDLNVWNDMFMCEKRTICVKRDLYVWKETYMYQMMCSSVKRDLHLSNKNSRFSTHMFWKDVWKETYACQKRGVCVKRDLHV